MHYVIRETTGCIEIVLTGIFISADIAKFKRLFARVVNTRGLSQVHLDISGINRLDDAALGMLFLFRDMAFKRDIALSLTAPSTHSEILRRELGLTTSVEQVA